jgi:hypothetical protein
MLRVCLFFFAGASGESRRVHRLTKWWSRADLVGGADHIFRMKKD